MLMIPAMHWGSVAPAAPMPPAALLFNAPLMWQLWPDAATGDATPYYSCSGSGGTVQDWEGVLRKCRANEARFPGARRVENMVLGSSQNLTVSPWTGYNVGLNSAAPVRTANYAGTGRTRLQLNRGNDLAAGVCSVYQVIVVPYTTAAYRITALFQSQTGGSSNIVMALSNQVVNITVTQNWQRLSVLVVGSYASAPSLAFGLYGTNSGGVNNSQTADFIIGDVQLELISGQSNTNPGEYVSVGMGAQVYANVDGVRYFGTKLANTMTGNVVNEITGTVPINTTNGASSTVCDAIGPLGILLDTQSQQIWAYGIEWDFSTVTPVNMTIATKNVAGPTGDYYGCAFVETAVSGQHYFYTSATLPFASTNSFCGFFIKPNVRNNIQLQFILGPDQGLGRYSLTGNGAVTLGQMNGGTGTFRSAGIVPYKDGWYYCWVAMSGVAASTAMSIYIVAENGVTYGGSGNPAWYLYGLTVMDTGSDVYTYPCQYATATRGNDQLRYAGSGQNINVSVGTAYAEIKTKWQTSWQHRTTLAADDAAKSPLMNHAGWPSTAIFIYDGNLAYQSGLPDAFTASRKVASSWNNGLLRQQVTGGGIPSGAGTSASAFTGTMATSSPYMGIGWNTGWTALALGGQIRNVKIWNVPASPSELAALTA